MSVSPGVVSTLWGTEWELWIGLLNDFKESITQLPNNVHPATLIADSKKDKRDKHQGSYSSTRSCPGMIHSPDRTRLEGRIWLHPD